MALIHKRVKRPGRPDVLEVRRVSGQPDDPGELVQQIELCPPEDFPPEVVAEVLGRIESAEAQ